MKYFLKLGIAPALAVIAMLSLSACSTPMGMQGCCHGMQCCKKMECCKDMKGCCCCNGDMKGMKGCPYTPKARK